MIAELEDAETRTRDNDVLTLQFCVNYGGRAEIAEPRGPLRGRSLQADLIRSASTSGRLPIISTSPTSPMSTCSCAPPASNATSNFLLWQSAYAELVFLDTLWPDFDRRHLWHAVELYASRDRRYGGALPNEAQDAQVPKISRV